MTTLQSYLDNIISESYKSALNKAHHDELEIQKKVADGIKNNSNTSKGKTLQVEEDNSESDLDTDGDKEQDNKSSSSKTLDAEKEKLKKGDIKADDIIEKLNSIRSGKSFKDETIHGAMNEYVESLSKAEKTALLAFLKGISQIVTGEISAQDASEPTDNPSNVKMKKKEHSEESTEKHVKPNVIKKVDNATQKKPSAEDTSAPTPIKAIKK